MMTDFCRVEERVFLDKMKKGLAPGKPRLDRRNALKNVDYVPHQPGDDSAPVTPVAHERGIRSKDDWKLKSFRVLGVDTEDEIEQLCRYLGISGPDGLGIPAAAWEARKSGSLQREVSSPILSQPACPPVVQQPPPSRHINVFELRHSSSDEDSVLSFQSSPSTSPISHARDSSGFSHFRIPKLSPTARDVESPNAVYDKPVTSPALSPSETFPAGDDKCPHQAFQATLQSQPKGVRNSATRRVTPSLQSKGELSRRHSEPVFKGSELYGETSPGGDEAGRDKAIHGRSKPKDGRVSRQEIGLSAKSVVGLVEDESKGAKESCRNSSHGSHGSLRWHGKSIGTPQGNLKHEQDTDVGTRSPNHDLKREQISEGTSQQLFKLEPDKVEIVKNLEAKGINPQPLTPAKPSWSSWQKGDLLGSGSFGTVYEGVGSNGVFFAVKEVSLSDQGRNAQQSIMQLEQEIALLSQFHHENIVQYLGTERQEDKLYIFLELVSKGSLASLYRKYELFGTQVQSYTQQILSGLKYLHDRLIVHRDIKCANILVDGNGKIKLADFGMAKEISKLDELKSCRGSAYWMAPEVIDPKKTYWLPADVWSLGCTVLEMATGYLPFRDLEWHRVLWKVGHGEAPPIPETLPEELRHFIKQCLEVNPKNRPTVDQLLTHPYVSMNLEESGPVTLVPPQLSPNFGGEIL